MSDEKANRLANSLIRQKNINVDTKHSPKHSVFYYKGVPIENHKTFLNVESYQVAVQAEKVGTISESIHASTVEIFDGSSARLPSASFTWKNSENTPSLKFENFHPASIPPECIEYPACASSEFQSGVIAGT